MNNVSKPLRWASGPPWLRGWLLLALLLTLLLAGRAARAQAPTVTALSPTRNQRNAPRTANVGVTFSQPVQNTAATRGAGQVYRQQRGGRMLVGASRRYGLNRSS